MRSPARDTGIRGALLRSLRWLVLFTVASCASAPTAGRVFVPTAPSACGSGRALVVHFYDVGQGLAVLVDLPDGRHILVDTGEDRGRTRHNHLLDRLTTDLNGAPIDLLWITHPHSDHVGGAVQVFRRIPVGMYVDNGRDLDHQLIAATRVAAKRAGTQVRIVGPENRSVPLPNSADVRLTAILPNAWPRRCDHNENDCSIGLRIDYCSSSVLFTGDAEAHEEQLIRFEPVSLLQVGHHGSHTSSSEAIIAQLHPTYAVISAGKIGERGNHYCHPRAATVRRLTRHLGGPGTRTIRAYDAGRCGDGAEWAEVPASDRLWATGRDGDVILQTTGDGMFAVR